MKFSLLTVAIVLTCGFAHAQDSIDAIRPQADFWWGSGSLNATVTAGDDYVLGDFSALVPLHSTLGQAGRLSGTVLFAEPYGQWVEQGATQLGVGLGFRQLFGNQPLAALNQFAPEGGPLAEGWYWGVNVSFDLAETLSDQRLRQLGVGAELGSRYLELRGRYHIPLDDGEESKIREISTDRLEYSRANVRVDTTITIDTLFTYLTESLEGYDVNASLLIPGLDRWLEARISGGYSRFESPTFNFIDYDSWRVGLEIRPVPAVVLGATWFENEAIVGDDWLFSVGLQLPFEFADIGGSQGGFWGHIKHAFKPRHRHLAERMREPTRRYVLPMQLATTLNDVKAKLTFHDRVSVILPDGRVVTFVGRSGSEDYSSTMAGSVSVSSSSMAMQDVAMLSSINMLSPVGLPSSTDGSMSTTIPLTSAMDVVPPSSSSTQAATTGQVFSSMLLQNTMSSHATWTPMVLAEGSF